MTRTGLSRVVRGFTLVAPLSLLACAESAAASDTSAQSAGLALADASPNQDRRPPPHHGPPPEAFEACSSKSAGDACTVALGSRSLAGTCVAPPADAPDTRLVCAPADRPPPPPGGPRERGEHPEGGAPPKPPEAAFAACDGKAADAACTVTLGDRSLTGVCLGPPREGASAGETRLACAPARPPR